MAIFSASEFVKKNGTQDANKPVKVKIDDIVIKLAPGKVVKATDDDVSKALASIKGGVDVAVKETTETGKTVTTPYILSAKMCKSLADTHTAHVQKEQATIAAALNS